MENSKISKDQFYNDYIENVYPNLLTKEARSIYKMSVEIGIYDEINSIFMIIDYLKVYEKPECSFLLTNRQKSILSL